MATSSTADGSVVLTIDMDVSDAEKKLAKLKQNIIKSEQQISDLEKKRDQAKQKSLFDSGVLDTEKAKLQEIKDRLADIRNMSKDKSIDLDTRDSYAAQIPALKQEYEDQKARVQGLQTEWNKTEAAVDRYNQKIDDAKQALALQEIEAGELVQQIEEAKKRAGGMGDMMQRAGDRIGQLNKRILSLAASAMVFNVISRSLTSLQQLTMKYIKTNDEARQAIAQMKGALLTLAQPLIEVVIPAFTLLVNILTRIITAAAQLVSSLFGKTVQQSKDGAKALHKEANAIGEVGEAADKAAGSLAGFDEINSISTENANGAGGGVSAGNEIAPDFSWMDGMDSGFLDRLKEIADLVGLIGAGFALWKIGTMLPGVLGQIATILGGILMTVGGLLTFWNGLTDAWENGVDWLNLIEMIGGLAAAAFGLYTIFEAIHPGWGKIAAGIALVAGGLTMLVTGFHDAMENGWNLQNTLLSIAGLLGTGLGISLITGSWIPLLVAGIASVLLALTIATGHGEELLDGIRSVIEGFKDFFVGIFTGDMEKAVGGIEKIFAGLKTSIGAVIDGVKDTLLSFLDWLDEKTGGKFHGIIEAAKGFVTTFFDDVKSIAGEWIEDIKQIFQGIIQFISGVFTQDWDMAWKGLQNIWKGAWNSIISVLEGAINLIIKGLNWLISQMNKISFDVPDWVPGVGGKSIGVNIPTITEAQIPRLARGAVIPPNREFMAVLGDQRSGNNLEAPESLLRQIQSEGNAEIVQLLRAVLSAVREGHIIMVDGTVFGRTAIRAINGITTASGKQQLKL